MTLLRLPLAPEPPGLRVERCTADEVNYLLASHHYLGPARSCALAFGLLRGHELVAGMLWDWPTARWLPPDGTWLELTRWVLTPAAGRNAGSRMFALVRRQLLAESTGGITTLVSYSDRSRGHTGALYRACGWEWAPTWHRLKPPPTGGGDWGDGRRREPKDRWVFRLRPDKGRDAYLVGDPARRVGYRGLTADLT